MLFLQFILYSSSFVGTLKNEIPGAALELCQLKLKQFSPDILKFSTKHEDNPFTLNCFMVPRTCLFIFDAGSRRLGSNNFRNSSYKEKTAGSARVSRLSFRFLRLWCDKQLNPEKQIRKNSSFVFHFFFWVLFLEMSNMVHFCKLRKLVHHSQRNGKLQFLCSVSGSKLDLRQPDN